ncbi:hypothetical protein [Gluconobacter kondonii]|uniref:hypothetical protein n=1 Tax=Gluconobacter kondonii TaxID=941463 RepID=UPI001B8B38D5|nr:hypothetical protein [Gluconobacter kondonii]MBS1058278.1 hypothetical protein [Gluconobacter kondonii]
MSPDDPTLHRETPPSSLAPNLALAHHNLLEHFRVRNGHTFGTDGAVVASLADLLVSLPNEERRTFVADVVSTVSSGEDLVASAVSSRAELVAWTDSQKRAELSARVFSEDRLALLRDILDPEEERSAA